MEASFVYLVSLFSFLCVCAFGCASTFTYFHILLMYPWYIYKGYQSFSSHSCFPQQSLSWSSPSWQRVCLLESPCVFTIWTHVCNFLGWTGVHVYGLHICASYARHCIFLPWGVALIFLLLFIHFLDFPLVIFSNIKQQLESYRSVHVTGSVHIFPPTNSTSNTTCSVKKLRLLENNKHLLVAIFFKSLQLFKSTAKLKSLEISVPVAAAGPSHFTVITTRSFTHGFTCTSSPSFRGGGPFSPPSVISILAITVTVKKIWQAWQVSLPRTRNGETVRLQLQKPITDCFHWFSFNEQY